MFYACPGCDGWGLIIRYLGGVSPYICDCHFCDGHGFFDLDW